MLVRAVRLRGKHKLADKWETDIHVVVKQAGGLPVYTIRPETKEGPLRTVHRDLLLPCGFLLVSAKVDRRVQSTPRKPRTRQSVDPDPEKDIFAYSDAENDNSVSWSPGPSIREAFTVTKLYEVPSHRHDDIDHPQVDDLAGEVDMPVAQPVSDIDLPADTTDLPESSPVGDSPLELTLVNDKSHNSDAPVSGADELPELDLISGSGGDLLMAESELVVEKVAGHVSEHCTVLEKQSRLNLTE